MRNKPHKEMSSLAVSGAGERNVLQMGLPRGGQPLRTDLGDPALSPHPKYRFRNRVHQDSLRPSYCEQPGLSAWIPF